MREYVCLYVHACVQVLTCWGRVMHTYIDGLVQDCSNSSALAMELLQSCTKPSIYASVNEAITGWDHVLFWWPDIHTILEKKYWQRYGILFLNLFFITAEIWYLFLFFFSLEQRYGILFLYFFFISLNTYKLTKTSVPLMYTIIEFMSSDDIQYSFSEYKLSFNKACYAMALVTRAALNI